MRTMDLQGFKAAAVDLYVATMIPEEAEILLDYADIRTDDSSVWLALDNYAEPTVELLLSVTEADKYVDALVRVEIGLLLKRCFDKTEDDYGNELYIMPAHVVALASGRGEEFDRLMSLSYVARQLDFIPTEDKKETVYYDGEDLRELDMMYVKYMCNKIKSERR